MKPGIFYCVLAAAFFLILFTGCTENGSDASGAVSDSHIQVKASADALYKSGVAEYDAGNYSAAQVCHFPQIHEIVEEENLTVPGILKNISQNLLRLGLNLTRYYH